MKKIRLILLVLCLMLIGTVSTEAANNFYWATCLSGGGDCLDGIDGAGLVDGDGGIVLRDNSGTYEGYFYRLEDTAETESSPNVIAPAKNAGNKRWRLVNIHAIGFTGPLVGTVTGNVTGDVTGGATKGTLADASYIVWPPAVPDSENSIPSFGTDGVGAWADLDSYATTADVAAAYVPLSTIVAAGDVLVGSAASTVTKIAKGSNNTFFGVNNAGTLGFHSSFNPVLVAAPVSDDTYSGTLASFVAGETLAQWDVVYCKNKSGVHACYKYDANGADKALPPRAMAVAAVDADASGTFLLNGIVRNDGWGQTTNQDEGKIVYADGGTAGAITLTKSTTTADMVAILGYVIEQNVIYFNPSPILVEVPTP